jgi:UDP-glucuronate 4-epimerase
MEHAESGSEHVWCPAERAVSTYLVTGCAGFVGSHLCDALLNDGHEVVGVDAFTPLYDRSLKQRNLAYALENPRFRLAEFDIAIAEGALAEALADVELVFHLAAQPGVRTSWDSFEHYVHRNLLATQRVFKAAADVDVRVVFASSSSVYGNIAPGATHESAVLRPISPYGVSKLSCEHLASAYAESFDLDVVTLRYFTVFGPRQRPDMAFTRIAAALVDGTPFELFGSGEQSRDFTFVADAASAAVLAGEHAPPGSVYNVGGGEEATVNRVLEIVQEIAGRPLEVLRTGTMHGDVRRTSADTSALRAECSWAPIVSLREGLRAQLDWYEELRGELTRPGLLATLPER